MAYPKFEAPEWQKGRVSALTQQFAAPQVGRLKRQMSPWMIGGGGPERGQEIRGAMRGYGEGLGGILGASRQAALGQYGQEYGRQFEGARLSHEAGMEEEKTIRGEAEAGRVRTWTTGERVGSEAARSEAARLLSIWQTAERIGTQKAKKEAAKLLRKWTTGERLGTQKWRTGEREETEAWQLKLGEKEEAERERERKRQAVMKREQAQKTMGWKPLKYYGYEHGGNPKVGTKYIVGEKGPELVEYDSGRFELVGTKGPEIRQFAEKGTVIPTGKTKKMLKSMFTPRAKGGRVTPPGGGIAAAINRYLMGKSMRPGTVGTPNWQIMMHTRPQLFSYLMATLGSKGPLMKQSQSHIRVRGKQPEKKKKQSRTC